MSKAENHGGKIEKREENLTKGDMFMDKNEKSENDETIVEGTETANDADDVESPDDAPESSLEKTGKAPFEGSILEQLEKMIPWNVFFLGMGILFLLLTIWNR